MSSAGLMNRQQRKKVFVRISTDERDRERALRERFADFWATASGEPRAIYDAFISASLLTPDVVLEAVDERSVRRWWVRPQQAAWPDDPLPDGGGYVQGSAKHIGTSSARLSAARCPAFIID